MTLENLRQKIVKSVSNYIFYGWVILLIAGVGIFVSGPGQSHTFSVFISPISKDLQLSATAISSAYGLATLVAALGLPMVGVAHRRGSGAGGTGYEAPGAVL